MARHIWNGLDGLRGLAVLAVVIFHLSVGWATNGYVGVDVFFALSGFLITWLLLDERSRTGQIGLPQFYMRRILRLYPALVATVLVVLVLGVLAGQSERVLPGAVAALAYAANWWIYTGHEALLLEHTWTLAIEEHFYLVWPVLVLLLTSRQRQLRSIGVIGAVLLSVVVLTPWPEVVDGVRGSYLRGAPIVWGSLLAALLRVRQPSERMRAALAPVGLAALVGLVAVMAIPWSLPGEWLTSLRSVPGMLSVIVIAACVTAPGSLVERLLSWRILRWVGRRAYGVYLYHLPIIMVLSFQLDFGLPRWGRSLFAFALTMLVAGLSYRLLESPFLKMKSRFSPAAAVVPTRK